MKDKIHITIGTPHRREFAVEYIVSLAATLQSGKFDIEFLPMAGTLLYHARNVIAETCETDYLLFIDTDVCWTPQDIERLVELDKDIAGGFYLSKDIARPAPPFPAEPSQTNFLPGGFMLIKRHVIEAFKEAKVRPFDWLPVAAVYPNAPEQGYTSTYFPEDASFCIQAGRLFGFELWCHPGVQLGHVGTMTRMDPEAAARWVKMCANSKSDQFIPY